MVPDVDPYLSRLDIIYCIILTRWELLMNDCIVLPTWAISIDHKHVHMHLKEVLCTGLGRYACLLQPAVCKGNVMEPKIQLINH